MLRGIATISIWADDVAAAAHWYANVLNIEPYFNRPGPDGRPAYVEFRIGDYQQELGIIDRRFAPAGHAPSGGTVVYWHVDDVEEAFRKLLGEGAKEHEGVTERGPGFVTASVLDPFGNVLGVMRNVHYLEVFAATPATKG